MESPGSNYSSYIQPFFRQTNLLISMKIAWLDPNTVYITPTFLIFEQIAIQNNMQPQEYLKINKIDCM